VQPSTYEISFAGQADAAVAAGFDDCAVFVDQGMTTLRANLPDQEALCALVQRITSLGLELVYLQLMTPPPEQLLSRSHRAVSAAYRRRMCPASISPLEG
jgi:hypothetical protein